MQIETPSSLRLTAETSPVNAPSFSGETSCPARANPEPARRRPTRSSAPKEGARAASTPGGTPAATRRSARASDADGDRYIFQFATTSRRALTASPSSPQRFDARQQLAGHEVQRRSAA